LLCVIDSIQTVMLIYKSSREKYVFEPFFRVVQHIMVLHPLFSPIAPLFF